MRALVKLALKQLLSKCLEEEDEAAVAIEAYKHDHH